MNTDTSSPMVEGAKEWMTDRLIRVEHDNPYHDWYYLPLPDAIELADRADAAEAHNKSLSKMLTATLIKLGAALRELASARARIKEFENATVWCAFCAHEGKGFVPSKPGAFHLDGAYNYVPLCERCEQWLENETTVPPLDLPNGI